jgi:hypothetical protein
MRPVRPLLALLLPLVLPASLAAQGVAFAVLRGADTVATERYTPGDPTWKGRLEIRKQPRPQLEEWSVVRAPDGPAALVEVTESEAAPSAREKARVIQRTRVIFRGDSVAIDAVTNGGLMTRLYGTTPGAMPYMNLSYGLIDLTVDEARRRHAGPGPVTVPLFNLGGGQTADATVTLDGTRGTLQVGAVRYELELDGAGRLVAAAIPAQGLRAVRVP